MYRIVTQHEMAYIVGQGQLVAIAPPPDGCFFVPTSITLPEEATSEGVGRYLASCVIRVQELSQYD